MIDETAVRVDWTKHVVIKGATEFPFDPREYWILAPSIVNWKEGDGWISPLEFGYMLHNAKIGQGILPPLATLTEHFTPRSLKQGDALAAEELIEERRVASHPEKPSRLNSYFLNTHREVAERRAETWGWQQRKLVRCHLLTTTGSLHVARVSNFEELARDPVLTHLADHYWEQSPGPITDQNKHDVEILADCGLYFPDWSGFELLDNPSIIAAQKKYKTKWSRLGRT